ncbi:hypothetical protein RND71_043675 [Anisodus tanguticus]|uniref:Cytokine-like nuclear factor N-PAC n=1 Tax=Anisodus tanguticus TaxID=243964 RepID=A0AAE1UQX9_9SOLA|nr:hypothetical protein RND71_043675 [Anisodus tanguticus]
MSDTAAPKYNIGDLVWAKMKGFSPWPGKIADPSTTKLKRPSDKSPSTPVKSEDKSTSNTPSNSAPQRNYSRTPFNSKNKKTLVSSSEEDLPLPKKSRTSISLDETQTNGVTSIFSKSSSVSTSVKSPTKTGARNLLARTSQYLMDSNSDVNNDKSDLDLGAVSAKSKTIKASSLKFGFIGLGLMGQRIVKNLINSGHSVTIWNRTPTKCKDFVNAGATKVTTPADVISASDITFSCLSDPAAVKEIVFGNCGVISEIKTGKGYVELTTMDPEVSNDVAEAIIARGGRFLEGSMIGNGKQQAEEGNLILVLAGDKSLFDDCKSTFQAISSHAFYLGGSVGDASKMGLVISMLAGNLIGALAESMALADRTGLSSKDLLEILSLSPLSCPTLLSKAKAMIEANFPTEMPLTHLQKDLRLALKIAEEYEHPLPITATTNEVFKHAKHLGYSDHDVSAVYIRSRF